MEKAKKSLEGGFGYCSVIFAWDSHDVVYSGTQPNCGFGDNLAKIDVSTYRPTSIALTDCPFFIVDFYNPSTGLALDACPRGLLKRILADLSHSTALSALAGMEFEWFNFNESPASLASKVSANLSPMTPGMCGYSLVRYLLL